MESFGGGQKDPMSALVVVVVVVVVVVDKGIVFGWPSHLCESSQYICVQPSLSVRAKVSEVVWIKVRGGRGVFTASRLSRLNRAMLSLHAMA